MSSRDKLDTNEILFIHLWTWNDTGVCVCVCRECAYRWSYTCLINIVFVLGSEEWPVG